MRTSTPMTVYMLHKIVVNVQCDPKKVSTE